MTVAGSCDRRVLLTFAAYVFLTKRDRFLLRFNFVAFIACWRVNVFGKAAYRWEYEISDLHSYSVGGQSEFHLHETNISRLRTFLSRGEFLQVIESGRRKKLMVFFVEHAPTQAGFNVTSIPVQGLPD